MQSLSFQRAQPSQLPLFQICRETDAFLLAVGEEARTILRGSKRKDLNQRCKLFGSFPYRVVSHGYSSHERSFTLLCIQLYKHRIVQYFEIALVFLFIASYCTYSIQSHGCPSTHPLLLIIIVTMYWQHPKHIFGHRITHVSFTSHRLDRETCRFCFRQMAQCPR